MTDAPPGAAPPPAPIEVKANAAPIVTRETFTIFVTAAFAFAADRLMHSDIAIAAVIPCGAIGATLGWRLWQALRLDTLLEDWLRPGREDVPWAKMAAVLVLARFCEPSSELHIAEDWFRRTALGDLLGIADDKVNDDRLYRALDQLLPHKAVLELHLKGRLGRLFGLEYDLLLYDITSTYFEGQAAANPQAQRGHSRDHRRD